MYSSVSVDGFIADGNDQPGPLFDWLSNGDVPLDESGEVKVSQTSYDYTRPYWDQIGTTLVGRHVFDMTDGWDGKPPSGIDHVVLVTHRPQPEGWDPEGAVPLRRRRRRSCGQRPGACGDYRQPGPSSALSGAPLPALHCLPGLRPPRLPSVLEPQHTRAGVDELAEHGPVDQPVPFVPDDQCGRVVRR